MNGQWMVTRDGVVLDNYWPIPNSTAFDFVKEVHQTRGAVIYSSQWTGWVPVDDCNGTSDLYGSIYMVQNLTISGSVVKGPEPTKCVVAI